MEKKYHLIFFALLLLVFAVQIARHVNDFYVPESDFFDYREKAIEMRQLHWPEESKRPPLYSALIALISLPIEGKFRELYAAEAIGVLSALAALWLIYRICGHFAGKYAFLVAWLWALHPTTLRMAIKPKPEILVTVLILWAFERFLSGDKKSYLLAFLATLVRYEGALAILAFAASDFLFQKQKIKTILYALLAGGFILVWTFLHSQGTGGSSYSDYYSDYQPGFAFIGTFWGGVIGFLPLQGYKLWAASGAVLLLLGLWYCYRHCKSQGTALLLFLIGFIGMHIVWPFSNVDYVVIGSWSVLLLIILGVRQIDEIASEYLAGFWNLLRRELEKPVAKIIGGLILVVMFIALLRIKFPYPQHNVNWGTLLTFIIPLACFLWWVTKSSQPEYWSSLCLSLSLFLILGFYLNSKTNADFFDIHYSKADSRLVGEWYQAHHQPGDKMVVDQPKVVAYYTDLDPEKDFAQLTSIPQGEPAQVAQWLREQRINYAAWLSTHKVYKKDDSWYKWKRDNRGWKTISFLETGKDISDFKLIEEVRTGPRWGFIYRVMPAANSQ